ncbi:MAG TPA: class I SAM-dependent methyltransferase [Verrucomicrobiae bacterium]|nr:class I SAM-dependent methyltransferase [Verrucomicrobiae bacterium]
MPNPTAPGGHPSPQNFFDTITAYQTTAALKGAIDLDLFTSIGDEAMTAAEAAAACRADVRGTRILCDYLVTLGFLNKQGDLFALTEDSKVFLDRKSPACLAGTMGFLLSPSITSNFADVAAAVRKGGTVAPAGGTMSVENPVWVDFAKAMAPMMAPVANAIAGLVPAAPGRKLKVLDIAAGHGIYGITIAEKHPDAEIVAVDWPGVLAVAKGNARARGVEARYLTIGGSAFDVDLGGGYDVALITNFLHHFDPPTCETFLRRVHAALAPGGRAFTVEFVPNDDRITPPQPARFALTMLVGTDHGDAYTFADLDRIFRSAGFAGSELRRLDPMPSAVVISRK